MSTDSYDTSVDIRAVDSARNTFDAIEDKPAEYYEPCHSKWLVKRYALFASPAIVVITFMLFFGRAGSFVTLLELVLLVLSVALGSFMIRRAHVEFRLRPFRMNPDEGILWEYQNGILFPWLMNDSQPEPYRSEELIFSTPNRTLAERIVPGWKNSGTLELMKGTEVVKTFTDLRDIDRILKCLAWYEAAPRRQQEENNQLEKQQVLSAQQLATHMGAIAEFLRGRTTTDDQILQVLRDISGKLDGLISAPEQVIAESPRDPDEDRDA